MAARLVESQIAPDGRVRSLAKDIPLNWVPDGWISGEAARSLIADRLARVADWARYRHSQAEGADAELLGFHRHGARGPVEREDEGAGTRSSAQTGNAYITAGSGSVAPPE